jgi:GDP-4-dehydro-6-deoxy-D-mannose reductase
MSLRWLVTGAQGFIGQSVCAHILATFPEAQVAGIGRSSKRIDLNGRYEYHSIDLLDLPSLVELVTRFKPDVVIHLASALRGDERSQLLRTNIEGTGILLDSLAKSACSPVFVLASSGAVYGNTGSLPLREEQACLPPDEYALSKLAAEHLAIILANRRGIKLRIARIFNAIGPGQDDRNVGGRIARQFAAILRGDAKCLKLGPLTPTRDFIDVRDVASALVFLANSQHAEGVFNVGSGRETSVRQLVSYFSALTGVHPEIESSEAPIDVPRHFADVSRITNLGFHCSFTIEQSVSELLKSCMGR